MKKIKFIFVIILYITINIYITPHIFNYINLFIWSLILIYLKKFKEKHYIRTIFNRKNLLLAFLISSLYNVLYFYLGFVFGFSKSPFNHEPLGILKNIIIQIIPIIGIEYLRNILANKNKDKLLIISLFITVLEINFNSLLFENKEAIFKVLCSYIIPLIIENILFTYLTVDNSYMIVAIFKIMNKLFLLILINIPSLDWFVTGSIKLINLAIIYIVFIRKERQNFMIIFIMVIISCFVLGLFKHEIIAILSNSMSPVFERGDAVIYKKLDDKQLKELKENTIIVYHLENKNIVHRIIKKIKEDNKVFYITKGDNNNAADLKKVSSNQIKGVYVFKIKYLGFPSIWLKEYLMN